MELQVWQQVTSIGERFSQPEAGDRPSGRRPKFLKRNLNMPKVKVASDGTLDSVANDEQSLNWRYQRRG